MDIASGVFPYNGFVALPDAGGKVLLHLSIVNLVRGGDGAGEGVSLPVRKVNGKGIEADGEVLFNGAEGQGEEAEALLHGAQSAHVKRALVGGARRQRL
ncbi:MAG: hypothetical protein BWY89_01701 [Bacteroidetes bacterium ADurb.BinA012]|nr:MAG: hypothetical protein BWY89_01701 [Bacteroidetes bacterium ADurb.BinA012]